MPLARDADGEPIEVPPEAVAWRVRKMPTRAGRPRLLIDAETGGPLDLPLATSYADFVDTVRESGSGRYRLSAIDRKGSAIPYCVAFTEVAVDETSGADDPMTLGEAFREALRCV